MPIYEYQCLDCGKVVEVLQKLSEAPLEVCGVECAGAPQGVGRLQRKISASNLPRGLMTSATTLAPDQPPACGSCGRAPGSCATD